MSKKVNPEKGLRSITFDFAGESRTLKFSHPSVGEFEADSNSVLRSIGALQDGRFLFADMLIASWIANAKVMSLALYHGFGKKLTLKEIDAGIDDFIQAGGSKQDLLRNIIRAYKYATDPSSVALLERSWKNSDDQNAILSDAELKHIEGVEKAIAVAKERQMDGSNLNGSPKSDSG
jgi:hypothetical protein